MKRKKRYNQRRGWERYGYLILSLLFIGAWWSLALHLSSSSPTRKTIPLSLFPISPLGSREKILQALQGDVPNMVELMEAWDAQARNLSEKGRPPLARLPPGVLDRARELAEREKDQHPRTKLLPQNYVAAALLLSLVPSASILALPKGLRETRYPFDTAKMGEIPLDITPFTLERIAEAHPTAAFVSSYSNPNVVASWKRRGFPLVLLPPLHTITEIMETIREISDICDVPAKGEILALFIEAAFLALDNLLRLHPAPPYTLFVFGGTPVKAPTNQTILGHLLERIDAIVPLANRKWLTRKVWSMPLDGPQLSDGGIDRLIVITHEKAFVPPPSLAESSLVKENRIACIERDVQDFSSPFVVLAYYDLCHALLTS